MTGQTIAHYQILEKLGEGGMGVVYKARDTHLDRFVAIKVLPPEKVADPERKQRFVQEAKAASALNHPNIITIYDIDSSDGVTFIAMEYVKGKTLDRLIRGKGAPLGETLKHAVQMADALAAAHAAGIIHRDIKPANIAVTETGLVKVLDFGLAKLSEPSDIGEAEATRTMRPKTESGVILGTVAYMSPEQAEGKPVDGRSDIFSFGSVLYEMTTGRRAFSGETRASTLAAILREDPKPASQMALETPREMERIISRCLRKDPLRRFQHMDEVKIALEELKQESESGKSAPPSKPRRGWFVPAAIVAVVLVLATGMGIVWSLRQANTPAQAPALTRLTSDSGLTTNPAISPDGKLLAYASDRGGEGHLDIWVRQIAGGDPIRVTHDPAGASEPSFSPDSSTIVFHSGRDGGGIYVVSTLGGEERLLAKRGHSPRVSPDGAWIALIRDEAIGIISLTGGPPRSIARDLDAARRPMWSADGKHILFLGRKGPLELGELDWWVAPLDGGPPVKTGALEALHLWMVAPDDWVGDQVFFSVGAGSSTNLWRVTLSPKTWRVAGPAERLTFGTAAESEASVTAGSQSTLRLVFASQTSNLDIWSLPADTNRGKVLGDIQRLTDDAALDGRPSVSADGRKMAFVSERYGRGDIWMKDLETGKERALTATPVYEHHPVISADGLKVIYSADPDNRPTYVIPAAGGEAEKLCDDCWVAEGLSADGRKLLFGSPGPGPRHLFTVFLLNLDSRKRFQLLSHPQWDLWGPSFSPDGRWISFFVTLGSEPHGAYVAPFREDKTLEEKDWVAVADGSAQQPRWSPDGNLLYFLSNRDGFLCIWAQRLELATKRLNGSPFPVYHSHSVRHSIAGDPPAVVRGRIVFTQNELTGNIWMMELPKGK